MWAMSATACSKVSLFACDGLVIPLTLRTYCSAAACTSSEVACGSKLYRVRMLRHMVPSSPLRRPSTRARALRMPPDPAPRCRCDRVPSPPRPAASPDLDQQHAADDEKHAACHHSGRGSGEEHLPEHAGDR